MPAARADLIPVVERENVIEMAPQNRAPILQAFRGICIHLRCCKSEVASATISWYPQSAASVGPALAAHNEVHD
jgi:hypothetical protein